MPIKDKLPVSYLLFTTRGRINRAYYWIGSLFIWTSFYVLYNGIEYFFTYQATWVLYPILYWSLFCTALKRLHDSNKSGYWLWLVILPVLGPLILVYLLGFKKGSRDFNRYGSVQGLAPDYFKNGDPEYIPHLKSGERIVNDVTQLNPVLVSNIEVPKSISELQEIIVTSDRPISIGGGRFSMGGQTASSYCTHIDMREFNKILDYNPKERIIKVEAGVRWCDIQKHIDSDDLSVKIMQTYANFTVGGSLSVNVHGRYIGLGPVILSVKSLQVILANGELVETSKTNKPEIFFGCIGCYNAIGVIVTVELELEENVRVKRIHKKMDSTKYKDYFFKNVRENQEVVFHNADIYPPFYKNIRAVSWIKTKEKVTEKNRLIPLASSYPIERYMIDSFSKSKIGKLRREYVIDPIYFSRKKIHWRNYEAGYDVLELEPETRKNSTYVLQEYFVPVQKFDVFLEAMSEIFIRYNVNVINISIRHANADAGSLLAWAKEEVFAFVVYYKQGTNDIEKNKVSIWTRELIDATILLNGSYYLPYQVHATKEQFHKAYPNAQKLFELKKQYDPDFKFRNVLWDSYYKQK